MLVKLTIKNFFTRFHTYLICLGIFLLALILSVLIFIGGMQLVLSLQPNQLVDRVQNYFLNDFQIQNIFEVLNLSILKRVYKDIEAMAGNSASSVTFGLFTVIAVCIFILYGSFKGSVALVGYLNKKKLKDKNTKNGIIPLIIKLFIGLGFSALLMVLISLWEWSGIFVLIIYLFVDALECIFSLHYVYFSKTPLKEMFKNKSVLKIMGLYFGSQLSLIIIAGLLWLISPIISVFVIFPLLAYSETNVTYTVATYYKEKI